MVDKVIILEGFTNPTDTSDFALGLEDAVIANQNDPDFTFSAESLEEAISDARKVRRVIMVPSNEAGFLRSSMEACAAMINGTAQDLILINDTRSGYNYGETPEGKMFLDKVSKYVNVVDNVSEAKFLV